MDRCPDPDPDPGATGASPGSAETAYTLSTTMVITAALVLLVLVGLTMVIRR